MHPPHVRLRPDLPTDVDIQDFSRFGEGYGAGSDAVRMAVARGELTALTSRDAS